MNLADDCFVHDKDRMQHFEAVKLLRQRLTPKVEKSTIKLNTAAGRVLAQNIQAPRNIPAFNNSAVDGYTFAFEDFEATGGVFPIRERIVAGNTDQLSIPGFSAARIFTGAKMPEGADTIAMQEDCKPYSQEGSHFVAIPSGLKKGANCRLAGEDVSANETIAESGNVLTPQDLAAIASAGIPEVEVFKPLRIGLLSSGDEILRPGDKFELGKVYDANHFMLLGLLGSLNAEILDLGVCPDKAEKVEELLNNRAKEFDVLISTGGASKGEEDYFVETLDKLGKCHLWQLAVKPGRPMSFGQIDQTLCFTLPGNPVAAFVCFLLYVYPSLMVLGGSKWKEPQRYQLPAGFSLTSKPDRREFLRGFPEVQSNGLTVVNKFQRDGSGLISGLRAASGLIEISEDTTRIKAGEMVDFIPFSEFGIN